MQKGMDCGIIKISFVCTSGEYISNAYYCSRIGEFYTTFGLPKWSFSLDGLVRVGSFDSLPAKCSYIGTKMDLIPDMLQCT